MEKIQTFLFDCVQCARCDFLRKCDMDRSRTKLSQFFLLLKSNDAVTENMNTLEATANLNFIRKVSY
jgi:hypothetical protein